MNTKLEPRGLAVVDLVKDLGDGVCSFSISAYSCL
jgi:hypothetical protein